MLTPNRGPARMGFASDAIGATAEAEVKAMRRAAERKRLLQRHRRSYKVWAT